MKRIIAIASASALLLVGTAFVVHAQTTGKVEPPCADITGGSGNYTAPTEDPLGTPTAAGNLTWDVKLDGVSCPDVQYVLTVYLDGRESDEAVVTPPIIASATMPGDGVSHTLRFSLEVNQHTAIEDFGEFVCVAASTIGGSGAPTSSKNGAAFDADGSGSVLLDRDPDGPAGGDMSGEVGNEYCAFVPDVGQGRTAG